MRAHRNRVYSDGAYDFENGVGAYCVVSVEHNQPPTWCASASSGKSPNEVETEGLIAGIAIAAALHKSNGFRSVVYCDSLSAIQNTRAVAKAAHVDVQFIKGHLLGKDEVVVDDNIKRHHWADVQAGMKLREIVVDKLSTSEQNSNQEVLTSKETSK